MVQQMKRECDTGTKNEGSVRLTGWVEDQQTAQAIVEPNEQIPGVHEITLTDHADSRSCQRSVNV